MRVSKLVFIILLVASFVKPQDIRKNSTDICYNDFPLLNAFTW